MSITYVFTNVRRTECQGRLRINSFFTQTYKLICAISHKYTEALWVSGESVIHNPELRPRSPAVRILEIADCHLHSFRIRFLGEWIIDPYDG